ncbi:hypothetical protein SUH3_05195 [Pseudosulfitobacter pseudonitzschiae]|uniref:Uncharacterized protein n=1 Tax=Pseudosulfitobacter pseudonitzschiae TaxID=1402135 RepID=A0A073JAR3_9RHOB|nr:hypothetical protein SUH3_05195 [Pseudosulfitobacter pseudonitzschiae]
MAQVVLNNGPRVDLVPKREAKRQRSLGSASGSALKNLKLKDFSETSPRDEPIPDNKAVISDGGGNLPVSHVRRHAPKCSASQPKRPEDTA